jgi:terminal uridylyltransferase
MKIWNVKNTESVGELWLGFIKYYSEFDWQNYTVSIRDTNLLLRTKKGWTKTKMAIEGI